MGKRYRTRMRGFGNAGGVMVSRETPHTLEALGHSLTNSSMAIYFAFALVAAYTNQRIDAQQSMRLDNLNSSPFTTNTDNRRNIPSSGLSTSAAPIPMNNFGITFIDATRTRTASPRLQDAKGRSRIERFIRTRSLTLKTLRTHTDWGWEAKRLWHTSQRPDNEGKRLW